MVSSPSSSNVFDVLNSCEPSENILQRSSRFKEAPQALSDGTYIVPWKNPISRSEDKRRLLEKIEELRLAKEINPSTKSKKSSRKNSKKK